MLSTGERLVKTAQISCLQLVTGLLCKCNVYTHSDSGGVVIVSTCSIQHLFSKESAEVRHTDSSEKYRSPQNI